MRKPTEVYIHIPFCVKKCDYCDFLSWAADKTGQEVYAQALLREIEGSVLSEDAVISTIFIGGGTPSSIPEEWIGRFLDKIKDRFCLCKDAEITLEANPGTLTRRKLLSYRHAGINRLSIGLQSADDAELLRLGRIHTFQDFMENYREAREIGFSNINVDMMMALPGQNVSSWMKSLEAVVRLAPEHISTYSLIVEPGTPFARQTLDLPSEEEERRMYEETVDFLRGNGYGQYEISNFARNGYECRHNIGYWTGTPYLGLGLGAASLIDECRYTNTESMEVYLKDSKTPHSIQMDRESLSVETQMEEFMFLGLRMTEGVSEEEFYRRFQREMSEVYGAVFDRFTDMGLLIRSGGRVHLSGQGVSVSNMVMSEFLL